MLNQLKAQARALEREAYVIYLAARDPRMPWYGRALIFLVIAHTFSPIDLVPDFIPVLGYLDDLIIIPGGIWFALRLIPPEVIVEARARAAMYNIDKNVGKAGAMIIILLWIAAAVAVVLFLCVLQKYN